MGNCNHCIDACCGCGFALYGATRDALQQFCHRYRIFNSVFYSKVFKRKENPPYTFLFIGFSLAFFGLSNILLGLSEWGMIDLGLWSHAWNRLLYEGAMLGLVIGVGSRLVPGILGWQEIVKSQREIYEKPIPFLQVIPKTILALALLFFASYFIEVQRFILGASLRLTIVSYFLIFYWKIHRFPKKKTRLNTAIWLTTWVFLLSGLLFLIWPYARSHAEHSYFISGFSLLILLIATRVILVHSGGGLDYESTSRMIPIATGFILLAAITRITAIIWPNVYLSHLGYASVLWLIGLGSWIFVMFPIVFMPSKGPQKA